MPGKDQLLADGAEHLNAERLIAGHQVQPGLVGQASRYHGFFVQGSDDLAMDRFLIVLGLVYPVFQIFKDPLKPVTCQFVRIPHPWPEPRVVSHQSPEKIIHGLHGRGGVGIGRQSRDHGIRWIAYCEGMVPFQGA